MYHVSAQGVDDDMLNVHYYYYYYKYNNNNDDNKNNKVTKFSNPQKPTHQVLRETRWDRPTTEATITDYNCTLYNSYNNRKYPRPAITYSLTELRKPTHTFWELSFTSSSIGYCSLRQTVPRCVKHD